MYSAEYRYCLMSVGRHSVYLLNCCKLFNIVDMYSSFCHSLNKVCSHYILVFTCTHNASMNHMGFFFFFLHFLDTSVNTFLRELLSSSTLGLKQI